MRVHGQLAMSVGGLIIDIVEIHPHRWWVNTIDRYDLQHSGDDPQQRTCAVYVDPQREPLKVGDQLWWQSSFCFWTPADNSRKDVRLMKIGFSGVPHPDTLKKGNANV